MEKHNKIFMVIDGSAIIHRAYHAMPSFTTSAGLPSGAVHGFFAMLLKLLSDVKPAYLAVTFDRAAPTFRKLLYVGYQAQRPEVGDELGGQFDMVRDTLRGGKIPVYEVDGFEADDVIGTIAKHVNQKLDNAICYIVTGDRDMMQLVNANTKVLMPIKGISEVMLYDAARVKEKFGVTSEEIIDYKALVGDASDNYPGVPGIGPKTASALLMKYKTFDGIYKHISDIEADNKNLAKKLAEGSDQGYLSQKLATIVSDVPFIFDLKACAIEHVSAEGLATKFAEYDLKTIGKRFADHFAGTESDTKKQMKLL